MSTKTDKSLGGNLSAAALSATDVEPAAHKDTRFFGHPLALSNLFGVEMWERFSYYGLQGVVLLYIYYAVKDGGLGLSQDAANSIVGAYGGALYLTSVVAGWLADRVLGRERTLFFSAIVVMIGHLTLSTVGGLVGLAIGISCIAIGGGGVKVASTSMVGSLYKKNDPRIDSGFALYYLGINLGGLIGPLIAGFLQVTYNFRIAFLSAAIGMALGLIQYLWGRKNIPADTREVLNPLNAAEKKKYGTIAAICGAALIALIAGGLFTPENIANIILIVSLVVTIAFYALIIRSPKVTPVERNRVWASVPLFVSQVAFWALYQQQFTVLTVYADKRLDRNIGGWQFPVPWVQDINPVFIILLSGVFTWLWTKWGDRQPSTNAKFAWANIIIGIAFFMFLPFANTGKNASPLLMITAILFVFTIGEMLISPVGFAVSTRLAPKQYTTQMVALFFLASALGTSLSGSLAAFYNPDNEVPYFLWLGVLSILVGFAMFAVGPWVKRMMEGIK